MLKVLGNMLNAFLRMGMVIGYARDIKKDEERRKRCKRYGIAAILFAIFAIPFALLAGLCLQWLHGEGALLFIFIIPLMVISLVSIVACIMYGLFYWIVQLYVNKRAITWIALVIMLACFTAAVLLALQVMGVTSLF